MGTIGFGKLKFGILSIRGVEFRDLGFGKSGFAKLIFGISISVFWYVIKFFIWSPENAFIISIFTLYFGPFAYSIFIFRQEKKIYDGTPLFYGYSVLASIYFPFSNEEEKLEKEEEFWFWV